MKLNHTLIGVLLSITTLMWGNSFASEQIMVDKDEYEQLKAAVKFLMEEREANNEAVQEAKEAAEAAAVSAQEANETAAEATEVAEAAAEAHGFFTIWIETF